MEPETTQPAIQLPGGIREMTESLLHFAGLELSREAATFAVFFILPFI